MPRGQKPKIYPQSIVDQVRRLYEDGMTQQEVANSIGLSQKVVWNVMRRHKIKTRTAAKRNQWGENNHMWQGDNAGKQAFHRRLYSRFGKPDKCAVCQTTKSNHYDYANLTGRYESLEDYVPMCRSCHWKYDDKVKNITGGRRKNA